jgi:D-alanyl-D-alanine carboxypeptidase
VPFFFCADQTRSVAPGSALKYANTNYVIEGLIIEKLTGQPAADEITKRIIVPVGSSDT